MSKWLSCKDSFSFLANVWPRHKGTGKVRILYTKEEKGSPVNFLDFKYRIHAGKYIHLQLSLLL